MLAHESLIPFFLMAKEKWINLIWKSNNLKIRLDDVQGPFFSRIIYGVWEVCRQMEGERAAAVGGREVGCVSI